MSLVPSQLFLQCWNSKGGNPSKSMFRSVKETTWGSSSSPYSAKIPAAFYSQKLCGSPFPALELWAGTFWCGAGTPRYSGYF